MGHATPRRRIRSWASGGKFAYPDDAEETPDTLQAIYEFDDFSMIWEHAVGIGLGPFQRAHGVAFVGNEGTLVVDRGRWEVFAETGTEAVKPYYKMDPVPEHTGPSQRGWTRPAHGELHRVHADARPAAMPRGDGQPRGRQRAPG